LESLLQLSFYSLVLSASPPTRRKTCIFDCSLRLNFSRKRHFATKILLVA
jgi:hypothetical protein